MQRTLLWNIYFDVRLYSSLVQEDVDMTMCDRKGFPPRSGNKVDESEIKIPTNLQASISEII